MELLEWICCHDEWVRWMTLHRSRDSRLSRRDNRNTPNRIATPLRTALSCISLLDSLNIHERCSSMSIRSAM